MLYHNVMFQYRDDATDDQRQAVLDALETLPDKVPGVLSFIFGENVWINPLSPHPMATMHLSVVATFEDGDAYLAYSHHPDKEKLVDELILPITLCAASCQFEPTVAK